MKKLFFYAMLAQSVFWVVSGILLQNSPSIILNILMAADGTCFAALAFFYNKNLFFKITAALFLAVNLILTFTDQIGVWDYVILVANLLCITSFSVIMVRAGKAKKAI